MLKKFITTINRSIFVGERFERNIQNLLTESYIFIVLGVVIALLNFAKGEYRIVDGIGLHVQTLKSTKADWKKEEVVVDEGHRHTDACYEKVLVCGKEEHVHSDACYAEKKPEGDAEAKPGDQSEEPSEEEPGEQPGKQPEEKSGEKPEEKSEENQPEGQPK